MNSSVKTVDIIIPVYRGIEETLSCLDSVINSKAHNQTALNIMVIYDAGPEPELLQSIQKRQTNTNFTLLINEENLGFVATVNRGMQQTDHDVILLNSDTEVANDWVDRLVFHGQQAKVASVTPFSNNATICSYPDFPLENDLPTGETVASLDRLFASTNTQQSVEIPTAIGFCMYIPRHAINQVGLFDVQAFGKGYGEENDFCLRATAQGLRNLHALDVFVWHKGSVSFSDSAVALRENALSILTRRYPDYESIIQRYIAEDPGKLNRLQVALAAIDTPAILILTNGLAEFEEKKLRFQHSTHPIIIIGKIANSLTIHLTGQSHPLTVNIPAAQIDNAIQLLLSIGYKSYFSTPTLAAEFSPLLKMVQLPNKAILHIVNNSGGGTIRYIESIAYDPNSKYRHFILYVKNEQQVLFDVSNNHYQLLNLFQDNHWHIKPLLILLAKQSVSIGMHAHSMVAGALEISELLRNRLPFIATLHDHYFLSDTAFEQTNISINPKHIERIQALLSQATKIIVPSHYLLEKAQPYFAADKLKLIPHDASLADTKLSLVTTELSNKLIDDANWNTKKPTFAIIGAVGPHKGADFISNLKTLFANEADYQMLHIGFCGRLPPDYQDNFIQHGLYLHSELPALLKKYGADLVVFVPAIPESFSYVLSDIAGTVPVLAADNGAIAERIQHQSLGDVYPYRTSPEVLKSMIIERLQTPQNNQPQVNEAGNMLCDTESYYHTLEPDMWASQPLSESELACFLTENLNEDTLKIGLVHLSKENYFLRNSETNLQTEITQLAENNEALRQNLAHYSKDIEALNKHIQVLEANLYYKIKKKLGCLKRHIFSLIKK